jgi:hypothetical protein
VGVTATTDEVLEEVEVVEVEEEVEVDDDVVGVLDGALAAAGVCQ